MAVQVASRVDVRQPDVLAALDGVSSKAGGLAGAAHAPVAVAVLRAGHARHRLLAASWVAHAHDGSERRERADVSVFFFSLGGGGDFTRGRRRRQ